MLDAGSAPAPTCEMLPPPLPQEDKDHPPPLSPKVFFSLFVRGVKLSPAILITFDYITE